MRKIEMTSLQIRRLTYAALYLALAMVLPFVTGQIPEIGSALCPMHIPALLCGFMCGWPWGLAVGFIAPLLRSVLFGMPALFPGAVAMAFDGGVPSPEAAPPKGNALCGSADFHDCGPPRLGRCAGDSGGPVRKLLHLGAVPGGRRHQRRSRHYSAARPDPRPGRCHGTGRAFPEPKLIERRSTPCFRNIWPPIPSGI